MSSLNSKRLELIAGLLPFVFGDVAHDRIGPAIDMHPRTVADAVLIRRHVDHVAAPGWARHSVMRLLVRHDNQPVISHLVELCDGASWHGARRRANARHVP